MCLWTNGNNKMIKTDSGATATKGGFAVKLFYVIASSGFKAITHGGSLSILN